MSKIFEKIATPLEGCFELQSIVRGNRRGSFIKTLHADAFTELGLAADFKEEYYSTSIKNVLRGLHFQTPPDDHEKLIYCPEGAVMDVAVDLRKNSATFGKHATCLLEGGKGNLMYLPKGFAHGFLTLSERAIIVCKTTTVYSPENDTGILWSSCGIDWQCDAPILSDKYMNLPPLAEFDLPFKGGDTVKFFEKVATSIDDCLELQPTICEDSCGSLPAPCKKSRPIWFGFLITCCGGEVIKEFNRQAA